MSASIHPTAIVSSQASISLSAEIGAYAIVEEHVEIGDGCKILPHAQVLAGTTIGSNTVIGRGAILGGDPQSLGFDPRTPSYLKIGDGNILREHVTVHRAVNEGAATQIGDGNLFMVGAHVGHDTIVGDHNVVANAALLAGHIILGNHTYIGGSAVFHQFIRIGDHCMIQGNGSFTKDIPHFTMSVKMNLLAGLNSIGLRRAEFTPDERRAVKLLYKILFRESKTLAQGIAKASEQKWDYPAKRLLEFVQNPSSKGTCSREFRSKKRTRISPGESESE